MTKTLPAKKDASPARAGVREAGDAHEAGDAPAFGERRVVFLLVAAAVLVYSNALGGQFLFDDPKQIVNNPGLRSWSNVLRAFTTDLWSFQRGTLANDVPPPYYRPLFTAYMTLGYHLFGLWEPGWHLMSLAVHAAATVLVFYLLKRLGGNVAVAAGAALLFALHPAHVESVAWVSGVPDPLAALFFIPSLIWFTRYRQEGARKWLALSVLAYSLSLLCKETAIALPLVVFVWDAARGAANSPGERFKRAALSCAPYVAVACLYLLARVAVLGAVSWTHSLMAGVPQSSILLTMPGVLLGYLRHLAAPFYLSLQYGTRVVSDASDARFLLPALALLALAATLWALRRRLNAEHATALALVFAPLLPVLNLKVLHPEYMIQDRYLYLPSIGFCWLAALAFARVARRRRALARAFAAVVLLGFGASTVLQNRVWDNGVALWGRAAAYAPGSWSVHYNLGLAYTQAKNYEAAKAEFLTSARINPNIAAVYNGLGLAEDALGESQPAAESLTLAARLDPEMTEAHNNLGALLFRRGEYAAAREQLTEALRRDPSAPSVRYNLARTLAASGEHAEAIPLYESLLASDPSDAEARFYLGMSYAAAGEKALAESQIERALGDVKAPERAAEMRAQLNRLRGTRQ